MIETCPVEAPEHFVCPITLQVMIHPLMTRSGLNFERSAILTWLGKGHADCPLTRQPMNVSDLLPNRYLEGQIRFWRKENGISEPEDSDENVVMLVLPVSRKTKARLLQRAKNTPGISPAPASAFRRLLGQRRTTADRPSQESRRGSTFAARQA